MLLEEYLIATGMIAVGQPEGPPLVSTASILSEEESRWTNARSALGPMFLNLRFLTRLTSSKYPDFTDNAEDFKQGAKTQGMSSVVGDQSAPSLKFRCAKPLE